MAYCLRSFSETLDQVLHPEKYRKKWVLDHAYRPQFQSLFENATILQEFLDKSSPLIQERISSLEDQIMDAAQKAADALETNITDQVLLNPKEQRFNISPPDMGEVIRVFEDARQELSKFKGATQPLNHIVLPRVSTARYPDSKMEPVGVEDDLDQLTWRLTSDQVTKLDVIPIVGMGGIGKTTLARILYDKFSSKLRFDRWAWVTVSQSYDPQLILKTILAFVTEKPLNEISQQPTSELIVTLHKALFGTRYLIVLDDIWSYEAWDDVKRAFPRENNRSRIIFTTREKLLVDYVGSNGYEMHLVNKENSWKILKGKIFGEESCPPDLEEIGKRISLKCGGLPLALQVIGGLLAHSERNKDFWEYVAHNVCAVIANTDDQFARIFSWSFTHLPHHLKPCFLYMGAFPEDYEIPASRLIKLWVAEGFLCPVPNKSLEEAALIHLNALADRNLIFVRTMKNGKTKSFGIHDLLRDLCLRKAQEKKFLYVKDSKTDILQKDMLSVRRVRVHRTDEDEKNAYGSLKLTPLVRSFLLTGYNNHGRFKSRLCYKSSLLRVLHARCELRFHLQMVLEGKSYEKCDLQGVFLQLVNLRYLCIDNNPLPGDVSVLTNLQTLIVDYLNSLTILDHLPQLRNLQFKSLEDKHSSFSLHLVSPHENLQRLSAVPLDHIFILREKLPNLRKLVIDTKESAFLYLSRVVDLTCFQKLESLKFTSTSFYALCYKTDYIFSSIIFPQSLKTLKLVKCAIHQKLLSEISILPELLVLKLSWCEFENNTWESTEGEFSQLQFLNINWSKMENWLVDESGNFPVLRHLVLDRVPYISEIPGDIGEIETLEMIELNICKASVFEFARKIHQEQLDNGNTLFQLRLGRTIEDIEKERAEKKDGGGEGEEKEDEDRGGWPSSGVEGDKDEQEDKEEDEDRGGRPSSGVEEEEDAQEDKEEEENRRGSTSGGRKTRTWAMKKAKEITKVKIPKYLEKIFGKHL